MSLGEVTTTSPKEWQTAAMLTSRFRDRYPLFKTTDGVHLAQLAGQEVREAEVEQDRLEEHGFESSLLHTFFEKASDHSKEFADILVFLFSYCQHKNLQPQFEAAWMRANGQGARSPIYDQLHELAVNLNEGDVDANVKHLLTYVISLSHHLPYSFSVIDAMTATIVKNQANRPERYYRNVDQQGRTLSEEDSRAKYAHTERALRMLRDYFGSPLLAEMHLPHQEQILDYRNSEVNLGLIAQRLEQQRQLMAVGLNETLRQVAADTQFNQPVLERRLRLAGAVEVPFPALHAA